MVYEKFNLKSRPLLNPCVNCLGVRMGSTEEKSRANLMSVIDDVRLKEEKGRVLVRLVYPVENVGYEASLVSVPKDKYEGYYRNYFKSLE